MSGGHGHDEGDEIVLHQETLWPTMLLAAVFAIITLFGLSQAGHSKIDVVIGKPAYEKIQNNMPKLEKHEQHSEVPMSNPSVTYKEEHKENAEHNEAAEPAIEEHKAEEEHK